jgi:hypothetical protein
MLLIGGWSLRYDSVVSGAGEGGEWPEDWLRLNAVCPYYTMFPLDFPLSQLKLYPDARRVLDPFCGRGTTLYAARLAGRQAVGIDINPVAVAIARAKTVQGSPAAVVRLARRILRDMAEGDVPEGEFWARGFHPGTLREVVALRDGLQTCPDTPTARLLRALLLGVLHGPRNKGAPSYLSNQMPRTYASKPAYAVRYWHKHGLSPVHVDTVDVIKRRADSFQNGVRSDRGITWAGVQFKLADYLSDAIGEDGEERIQWVREQGLVRHALNEILGVGGWRTDARDAKTGRPRPVRWIIATAQAKRREAGLPALPADWPPGELGPPPDDAFL